MSDQPSSNEAPKTASAEGPDGLPKHKQLTMSQHLFIWSMVIIVGVLFGMGSTVPFLSGQQRTVAGVSETDILARKRVAERLERILGQSFTPRYRGGDILEIYARQLRMIRVAEAQGLKPRGDELHRIVTEFLATPMRGGKRNYQQALLDHEGGPDGVTLAELERFLAENHAQQALGMRHLAVAVVAPRLAQEAAQRLYSRIEADEVVIDAEPLLPEVKADDPELAKTYEELRRERFVRPATAKVQLAWVDLAPLKAAVAVDDAGVQKYYDEHKDSYRRPKTDGSMEPRPLAEVAEEIKTAIRSEKALAQAQALAQKLSDEVGDKGLDGQADPAPFVAAVKAAGLQLREAEIKEAKGVLDLGPQGRLNDNLQLFAKQKGFTSMNLKSDGPEATWLVLRLDGISPAGTQSLDEVRPQVMRHLAGQRAWKALLASAQELRSAAEAAGPGGLAKAMASAGARWKTTPTKVTLQAVEQIALPDAAKPGASAGDPVVAASLAMPAHPVLVCVSSRNDAGGLPSVRLLQMSAWKDAPAFDESQREMYTAQVRNELMEYCQELFYADLMRKISEP